jgi:hypothetical protein
MKKIMFGLILGIGLTLTASVYADDIQTMIGKTVEGSFPLEIDGKLSEKDAIVIEGTSYIPVRAAGELFGYEVSFIDSKVKLEPIEGVVNVDELEKYHQERQAAYDKLKAEQANIKTPEQLKEEELMEKIKAEAAELEEKRKAAQEELKKLSEDQQQAQ